MQVNRKILIFAYLIFTIYCTSIILDYNSLQSYSELKKQALLIDSLAYMNRRNALLDPIDFVDETFRRKDILEYCVEMRDYYDEDEEKKNEIAKKIAAFKELQLNKKENL